MVIEIGDLVQHSDGDIGIVLDKMEETDEDLQSWARDNIEYQRDYLYEIHWMRDGFLRMTRYTHLEVINENK